MIVRHTCVKIASERRPTRAAATTDDLLMGVRSQMRAASALQPPARATPAFGASVHPLAWALHAFGDTLPVETYTTTPTTQIAGGNAPDLAWIFENSSQKEGTLFAYPFCTSPFGVFGNADLLKQAGQSVCLRLGRLGGRGMERGRQDLRLQQARDDRGDGLPAQGDLHRQGDARPRHHGRLLRR
ncbi:hypothetical protein [Nonomuraea montanisoli]|uniref:hypothetical protein n=1 Tax=Nonomuraea montanisoli TaxID=2741721 RepID=UPI0019635AAE|nr:hypothetical protein [Nonomuraea montanisoli]